MFGPVGLGSREWRSDENLAGSEHRQGWQHSLGLHSSELYPGIYYLVY